MNQSEKIIINACVGLLNTTLGSMTIEDADNVVRQVIQILQTI